MSMYYKIKVNLYKSNLVHKLKGKLRKFFGSGVSKNEDVKQKLISKYVRGKTFADIGCMWGVHGYFSFYAEEMGAKESTGFDIYPESDEFKKMKKERNSRVKFIRGDINSMDIVKVLGDHQVVYCTGLLYHVPDPLFTLSRLRQITSEVLILGSAIIPENRDFRNMAIFYPFLESRNRKLWSLLQGSQLSITEPFDPKQGYANWTWGFTPSCLEALIRTAGFEIIEKKYEKFYGYVVCKKTENQFIPVSGDWTFPDNKEIIDQYKL